MDEIKTSLNIRDTNGVLVDLTRDVTKSHQTLNQPSAVMKLSTPMSGKNVSTRYPEIHLKDIRRPTTLRAASAAFGNFSAFQDPANLTYAQFKTIRLLRTDSILLNEYDRKQVEQQYSVLASKSGDFILTNQEKDLNRLFVDEEAALVALKIYTSATAEGGPDGTQPALSTTVAGTLPAIKDGQRLTGVITDLTSDNVIGVLREAIGSLNRLGSPKSAEKEYPFSINGIPLNEITITTTYRGALAIKDSFTTTFIDLKSSDQKLNFTGIVGYVDTVPVILTNQLPSNVEYRVASTRALLRKTPSGDDLEYIGAVKDAAAINVAGTTINLGPSDKVLQFETPHILANAYVEEAIMIRASGITILEDKSDISKLADLLKEDIKKLSE